MNLTRRLTPDLNKLQAFECAARHANFTLAARELNLTQSAVSRQIKDLEAQLGIALFERARQRVFLSGAGQRFLPEVRRLLAQTEDSMLRIMSSPHGSALTLAVPPTFGTRWFLPRLPQFLALNPGAALNIASRSKPFDFEETSFDAAIYAGAPIWAQATCRFVCREEVLPVASPRLLAAGGHPLDLIAAGPFLHLDTRPRAWSDWFERLRGGETATYRGHRFDQFGMVIEAAVAGMGFALLPLYLIEAELERGALVIAADMPLPTKNSYYLAVPDRAAENPLVGRLYDWMVAQVDPRAWESGAPA